VSLQMFQLLFDLGDYATTYRATRDAYLKAANGAYCAGKRARSLASHARAARSTGIWGRSMRGAAAAAGTELEQQHELSIC